MNRDLNLKSESIFTKLSEDVKRWLERPFEEEEIWKIIKYCGKKKSLSPDGYPLELCKVACPVIKGDILVVSK